MGGSSSKRQLEELLADKSHVKHWGVVHTCSLSEWTKGQAAIWGFDACVNYSTRQDSRLQPWATRGRHFVAQIPAPETQDIDMSSARMYATMAIEEKKNKHQVQCVDLPLSYFKDGVHFVEVIGFKDTRVLVQVTTKNKRTDLLLVDMERDTVMVVHRQRPLQQGNKPYLLEASISPDFTHILLKPNAFYVHSQNVHGIRDEILCVFCTQKCQRQGSKIGRLSRTGSVATGKSTNTTHAQLSRGSSLSGSRKSHENSSAKSPDMSDNKGNDLGNETDFSLHEGEALRMAMTFDPRYQHNRVILANAVENGKPIICMYDIERRETVLQNEIYKSNERTALHIVFSPGGNFIALPLILGDYKSTPPFVFSDIKLFNANTLDCVCSLPSKGIMGGYINLVPVSVFPMFSSSGAFLALPVSKAHPESVYQRGLLRVGSVDIHRVAPLMHLQSMCRTKIRQCMKRDQITRLPIPEALKRFLLFKPFLE